MYLGERISCWNLVFSNRAFLHWLRSHAVNVTYSYFEAWRGFLLNTLIISFKNFPFIFPAVPTCMTT